MVAAEGADAASMKSAFKGANVIFTTTDFFSAFGPALEEKAKQQGKQSNELAYDIELQQGKNAVDAAAATLDSLEYLIMSVLGPAKKLSGGKYTKIYHFDAKAEAVEYLQSTYPDLEKKTSLIQLPFYVNNWKEGANVRPRKVNLHETSVLSIAA